MKKKIHHSFSPNQEEIPILQNQPIWNFILKGKKKPITRFSTSSPFNIPNQPPNIPNLEFHFEMTHDKFLKKKEKILFVL